MSEKKTIEITKDQQSLIIEALGLKLGALKTSIESLQDDGLHGLARDLYPKSDEVIEIQNLVRGA